MRGSSSALLPSTREEKAHLEGNRVFLLTKERQLSLPRLGRNFTITKRHKNSLHCFKTSTNFCNTPNFNLKDTSQRLSTSSLQTPQALGQQVLLGVFPPPLAR